MTFIERIQERIEKNTVKSMLSWKDNDGTVHMEEVLLKRSKMPVMGDWARIYPPIDEAGKINWINLIFGGKRNLIKLIVVLAIVGMVLLQFKELFVHIEAIKSSICYQSCVDLNNVVSTPTLIPFN